MIKKILNKQGKSEKLLIMVLLILLIPLTVLGVIATDSLIDGEATEDTIEDPIDDKEVIDEKLSSEEPDEPELPDLCENVICEDSSIECPDSFIALCSNNCNLETGECNSCSLDCTEHETSTPEINDSDKEPEPEIDPEPEPWSEPEINIQFFHANKITRGELTEIKALMTNSGTIAKDVSATWQLSPDFEIVSGNKVENCGDLDTGDSCTATINVQTLHSVSLGENQIKMRINYENEI